MTFAIEGTLFKEPGAPANTPPLVLFFEEKAVKDERASREGPPVFDTVCQVRVVVAGSRSNEGPIYEIQRTRQDGTVKIDQQAYRRFGKPFEEWRQGKTAAHAGTPLEQWPLMDVAMVATLKVSHVYTVQQLAELSDGALDNVIRRGGREWREKARAWLDEAKQAAGDVEARATIARQQEQIEQLTKQVAELMRKGNQQTLGYDKPKRSRQTRDDEEVTVDVVENPGPEDRRL